ncbi:serine/threonine-protein kinase [Myxococcus sp. SDU36]|uniref:serine/threonine protein kinase n=1 Tax=Myxococcus sp. SDU36 TaxID=2831967 RepID=UPI002542A6E4|nr:serine/threonine-protein kinase [Myxococcus sp. SDU36]WIG94098.1 serine/threonine protein kinase [Myxococcus sp. SDU36]
MPAEGFPIDFYRGERIGKYEVVTQLSVGGMAELFLGFTSGPGGFRKYVVIKRVLPDARDNAQFERMFLDEARITAAFNHPNIAQVFDLGREDDGLYLAMEFIAGQNLNQITGACLRRHEQLPLGFTLSVARDVCMALHYAHTYTAPSGAPSPVIHRDVAQKNIMVTYDGVVKLLDFGIAKAKDSLERTNVGTVKGTTGYMSPEQVRGETLDGRSDLFAVGVMLHELITGARLFAGQNERDEMMKILEEPVPWPSHVAPHVPEEVSKVVMRALERSREKRFATGRDMARAIEAAAGKLLLDAHDRAALMKDLFAERMSATRVMLESADGTTNGVMLESAKRALRGDDGPYLPERKDLPTPSNGVAGMPRKPSRKVQAAVAPRKPAAAGPRQPPESKTSNVLWGLVLLGILVGGGYAAWHLSKVLNETVEEEDASALRTLPRHDPNLPIYPVPGYDAPTPDAGTPEAPAKAVGAAVGGEDVEESRPKEAASPRPAKGRGKLTLLVLPEAEVFRGKKRVGRTPMFNVAMPVGEHDLTLVGPDGKKRMLSVPITAGETTQFRLKLAEIPER